MSSDSQSQDAHAERVLVHRLRAKQLSVQEAREVLLTAGASEDGCDQTIADFTQRHYLDDLSFAGNIARAGVERQGHGITRVKRTLAERGISSELADQVLAEFQNDELERALRFAQTRGSRMSRLDAEVALRRLYGQLVRRGFSSGVAMNAARQTLTSAGTDLD